MPEVPPWIHQCLSKTFMIRYFGNIFRSKTTKSHDELLMTTPKSEKLKKRLGDFFKLDSLRKKKKKKKKRSPDGGYVTASEETLDLDKSRDSIPVLDDEPVRR